MKIQPNPHVETFNAEQTIDSLRAELKSKQPSAQNQLLELRLARLEERVRALEAAVLGKTDRR